MFCWNISFSANLLFMKSVYWTYTIAWHFFVESSFLNPFCSLSWNDSSFGKHICNLNIQIMRYSNSTTFSNLWQSLNTIFYTASLFKCQPLALGNSEGRTKELDKNGLSALKIKETKIYVLKKTLKPQNICKQTHKYNINQIHVILGVKVRNMKMHFNTGCTWRRVGQWTLMMQIYVLLFGYCCLVALYNNIKKSSRR